MKRPSLASVPASDTPDIPARTGLKPSLTLWRDRRGAAALEYALLVSLIVAPVTVAAVEYSKALQGLFGKISQISQQAAGSCKANT